MTGFDTFYTPYCPIMDRDCLGRKCAMALLTQSIYPSDSTSYWRCGLVRTERKTDIERAHVIDQEPRRDG